MGDRVMLDILLDGYKGPMTYLITLYKVRNRNGWIHTTVTLHNLKMIAMFNTRYHVVISSYSILIDGFVGPWCV